ncbi:unnamed protein product [Pichia kudriavzevii]
MCFTELLLWRNNDKEEDPVIVTEDANGLEMHLLGETSLQKMDTFLIEDETLARLCKVEIILIASTHSKKKSTHLVVGQLFDYYGIKYTLLETTTPKSITEFAQRNYTTGQEYLFLFFSGDTCLFEFVNFFYREFANPEDIPSTTFLPFPHGTGNAMANSIGLHDDISCIQALFKFNRHHLPLYSLQTSATLLPTNPALSNLADLSQTPILFTVVASWGLHSLIVYESDKSELRSRYGAERFRIAATKILEENPVFKGSILNNKLYYSFQNGWRESPIECTQDLSYFVLAALSNFEEKFTISPASLVERDQLHMVAIPYSPSVEVMELMNAAYDNGRHISSNLVCYKPVDQELTITLNEATDPDKCIICLDGSSWKVTGPDKKLVFSYVDQSFLHFLSL